MARKSRKKQPIKADARKVEGISAEAQSFDTSSHTTGPDFGEREKEEEVKDDENEGEELKDAGEEDDKNERDWDEKTTEESTEEKGEENTEENVEEALKGEEDLPSQEKEEDLSSEQIGLETTLSDAADQQSEKETDMVQDKTESEATQAGAENSATESEAFERTSVHGESDDDDFGSFDEASIEDLEPETPAQTESGFPRLDDIVQILLPSSPPRATEHRQLLNEGASQRFSKLSEAPRLQPPSWVKSKMRSNLLQNLGLPTDLEDVESSSMLSYRSHPRPKPATEHEIDWSTIELPEVTLSEKEKQDYANNSASILAALEENVTSYTASTLAEFSAEVLEQKLKAMSNHHSKLLQLCALGKENIEELRQSHAVYESVVENLVGYNQKIQRNELLEKLSRSKNKKGKKTF